MLTQLRCAATVGLIVALSLAACSRPQKPEFRGLDRVELVGASLEGKLVFTGEAVFFNPNSVGLDVTGMELEAFVNENKVADIEQKVKLRAEPKSEFTLPLEIRVPISEVYADLSDLIGSVLSAPTVDLRVKGEVRVDVLGISIGVPFDHAESHELERGAR